MSQDFLYKIRGGVLNSAANLQKREEAKDQAREFVMNRLTKTLAVDRPKFADTQLSMSKPFEAMNKREQEQEQERKRAVQNALRLKTQSLQPLSPDVQVGRGLSFLVREPTITKFRSAEWAKESKEVTDSFEVGAKSTLVALKKSAVVFGKYEVEKTESLSQRFLTDRPKFAPGYVEGVGLGTDKVLPKINEAISVYEELQAKEWSRLQKPWQKKVAMVGAGATTVIGAVGAAYLTGNPIIGSTVLANMGASDIYLGARDAGKSPEEAATAYGASFVGQYALESFGVMNLMGKNTLFKKMIGEGLEEVSQQAWNDVVGKVGYDKAVSTLEEYWDNFWVGTVTGGIAGKVLSFIEGSPEAKAAKQLEKAGATPEQAKEVVQTFYTQSQLVNHKLVMQMRESFGESRLAGLRGLDGSKPRPGIERAAPLTEVSPELKPLYEEAKKYKSAEEFYKKYIGSSTQYGEYNPELRLGGTEGGVKITDLGIDPDKTVTIYRGIDDTTGKIKKSINDGDFVTTDYESALAYASGKENVVSKKVKAKDLILEDEADFFKEEPFFTGAEYIYTTKYDAPKPLTKSQLTDIWNQANLTTTQLPSDLAFRTGPEGEAFGKARPGIEIPANVEQTRQYQLLEEEVKLGIEADVLEETRKMFNKDQLKILTKIKRSVGDMDVEEARAAMPEVSRALEMIQEANPGIRTDDEALEFLRDLPLWSDVKEVRAEKARITKELKDLQEAKKQRDMEQRRKKVVAIRDYLGLSDSDLKKVTRKDFRLMSEREFNVFLDDVRQKAVKLADTKQAKAELMDLISQKEFEKLDNYRQAMEYPPIDKMTALQLRDFTKALEPFHAGDVFLTKRQIEVVDRTSLKGIRTVREAREALVSNIKKDMGKEVSLEEVSNFKVDSLADAVRYDTALAEKNPFFGYVVQRTQRHILEGEYNFLTIQDEVNRLARSADKSRNRGVIGTIKHAVIPKHTEIVEYLEAPVDQKIEYAKALTKEELDYAYFIEQYYSQAYDHLVQVKELYGSRFVDQYFTHTRKTFLEKWGDDGIIGAFKNYWQAHKEDQIVANIIDQDTGNILPKAKFFQYTLQRTGDVDPSHNVTRVFLQYAKTFERKKMFDKMIPEVDIYTQSLAPTQLTPRGLEVDRKLKTFINKYLNNKKGRKETFGGAVSQNGWADMHLRMINTFVSLLDLGLNVGSSVAATVGEQVMTFQGLGTAKYIKAWKRRIWDTGVQRLKHKNAGKILKQAEPFIGRNIWTELAEPNKGFGERGLQLIFSAYAQSSVEANKLFLLANLTKEELEAGEISFDRMADLRLEAGRWRDMGKDVKSIFGSTSLGSAFTKYKGWAIPILRTTISNLEAMAGDFIKGRPVKALTSKEAQELYRATSTSAFIILVGAHLLGVDKDEKDFVSQLKAKAYREAMTFLGGIDPTVIVGTPRAATFIQGLATNLKRIALWEQYEQDSQWGEKGDLKGVAGLVRQFTPAAAKQADFTTPVNKYVNQLRDKNIPKSRARALLRLRVNKGIITQDQMDKILDKAY